MITKLSNAIADSLLKKNIMESKEREVYVYGFFIIISHIIFFLVTVLIGILFKIPFYAMIFFLSFSSVRGFTGGIHAKTEFLCDILSTVSILICLAAVKTVIIHSLTYIALAALALSSVLIIVLKPVDTPQKALSQSEKSHFHKKSITLTILYCILSVVFMLLKLPGITVAISAGLSLASVLLVLGKLKHN